MSLNDYFTDSGFRTQFASVANSPQRTAPPDEDAVPAVPFDELPTRMQLDIAGRACRTRYKDAMHEAFSIDNKVAFEKFCRLVLDSSCADSDVGTAAREVALQYLSRCAAVQEDDLSELGC